MALQRIHFIVSGLVQGVFFRVHTVEAATTHGVTGWVRNIENGKVEGEAQGEKEKLDLFLADVKRGPSAARVDNVWTEEMDVKEGETGFRKIRWSDKP